MDSVTANNDTVGLQIDLDIMAAMVADEELLFPSPPSSEITDSDQDLESQSYPLSPLPSPALPLQHRHTKGFHNLLQIFLAPEAYDIVSSTTLFVETVWHSDKAANRLHSVAMCTESGAQFLLITCDKHSDEFDMAMFVPTTTRPLLLSDSEISIYKAAGMLELAIRTRMLIGHGIVRMLDYFGIPHPTNRVVELHTSPEECWQAQHLNYLTLNNAISRDVEAFAGAKDQTQALCERTWEMCCRSPSWISGCGVSANHHPQWLICMVGASHVQQYGGIFVPSNWNDPFAEKVLAHASRLEARVRGLRRMAAKSFPL